jgi:hypothetical protein
MPAKALRPLAAVLAGALLLTACSGSSDDDPAPSSASESESATSGSSEAGSAPEDESPLGQAARVAGVDPANPPEPIASTTMPAGGPGEQANDTSLRVDLIVLRRQDNILILTVAFTPEGEGDTAAPYYGWTGTRYEPAIIDGVNLKKHEVVTATSAGGVQTATGPTSTRFGFGETFYTYAVFAAPPEDVTTVTVHTGTGAAPFTDVTIQ